MKTGVRLCVLMGAICSIAIGAPALAKGEWVLKPKVKPVSAARLGLADAKLPLVGARLVYRGGYTPLNTMVRPRFVGGMVDIYPSTQMGFRFSVGTRYFARRNFWIAAEQATNGVLYDPHMTRGGRGLIRGYKRYTPAATIGYDISPMNGLVLGIEGGAINGRATPVVRTPRLGFGRGNDRHDGLNEVVSLSARLAF